MKTAVGIGIAGAAGALARYAVDGLVSKRTAGGFPWGTLTVNVTGSFLLGVLFVLLAERFMVAPWIRSSLLIGFIGAYTTFSTLSLETFRLFQDGAHMLALANGLGSLAAGLLAVYGGIVVGRAV
ncbi:MAG: fluoride efflux transporter CrcB [Actinomycetota bacterium]